MSTVRLSREWPEFGARLRGLIHERGYKNVAQFADAIGVRITQAYKWVSGTHPSRANLEHLAAFLQENPAWLQWGDWVPREPAGDDDCDPVPNLVETIRRRNLHPHDLLRLHAAVTEEVARRIPDVAKRAMIA